MEIVVFGAGSLGSLLGGVLAREHHVTLVGRDPHVSAVEENGLSIEAEIDTHTHPDATTDGTDLSADLALATVKSYDTVEAARTLATGEFDAVCSLQNGMGNEEQLAAGLDVPILAGTTSYGAILTDPGRVECTGIGEVVFGPAGGGESALATRIGEAFSAAELRCSAVDDMPRRLWEKLAVNAAINPVTALAGVDNGAVLEGPARSIAGEAARETARVAREHDIELSDEAALDALRRVATDTATNTSSMAQDFENGQRTEIDAINGYVVRHATSPVPTNALLVGLVKAWEASRGLC